MNKASQKTLDDGDRGAEIGSFSDAVNLATNAHKGQTRKNSDTPYIEHPLEVAEIVKTMTDDVDAWIAAVLHDTVEDTAVSIENIRQKFGDRVAKLVASDTENKRESLPAEDTWKIRKQETIDHLNASSNILEKMIVLADKLSNIRQLKNDYDECGDEIWQNFHQKDKNEQAWYYKSILQATKSLSMYPAWQEYKKLVEEVFG